MSPLPVFASVTFRGHKEMSSILADQYRSRTVYEPKCGGWGGAWGLRPSASEYSCAVCTLRDMEPKYVNFGDLTPYLTYGITRNSWSAVVVSPGVWTAVLLQDPVAAAHRYLLEQLGHVSGAPDHVILLIRLRRAAWQLRRTAWQLRGTAWQLRGTAWQLRGTAWQLRGTAWQLRWRRSRPPVCSDGAKIFPKITCSINFFFRSNWWLILYLTFIMCNMLYNM